MRRLGIALGLFTFIVVMFFWSLMNNWTASVFIMFCASYPAFGFMCVAIVNAPVKLVIESENATARQNDANTAPARRNVRKLGGDQQAIG